MVMSTSVGIVLSKGSISCKIWNAYLQCRRVFINYHVRASGTNSDSNPQAADGKFL
jgi:hypothetical protein